MKTHASSQVLRDGNWISLCGRRVEEKIRPRAWPSCKTCMARFIKEALRLLPKAVAP